VRQRLLRGLPRGGSAALQGLPRGAALRGDQKRMSTETDTCREYVVPKLQAAGWENVAEIIGKFGGTDRLPTPIFQ